MDAAPDLSPKAATAATAARNAEAARSPHLAQSAEERERARRGRIAGPDEPTIDHPGGWPVWDHGAFAFLDDENAPAEGAPVAVGAGARNTEAGLFEVAPGFWQVRGYDLANLTVVDGTEGRIVIDPLTSNQTAAAALALVNRHLGSGRSPR